MQTNDIVSSWLSGDGHDNPAGPLFIAGAGATEDALTNADAGLNMLTSATTMSCRGGCICC